MKLLLHACCGPCSLYPAAVLREEGEEISLFFSNANIHPYREWKARKNALEQVALEDGIPLLIDRDYPLESFLSGALAADKRCHYCYGLRLRAAAACGIAQKADGFTTTLLVSPYQDHEAIAAIGHAVGKELGIPFLYRDFRPGFRWGQGEAERRGLYRQKYCGCVFSERDRFQKVKKNGMAKSR